MFVIENELMEGSTLKPSTQLAEYKKNAHSWIKLMKLKIEYELEE